jgi:threonine dehydrogenase-like Zn-dependent dehydrogenase
VELIASGKVKTDPLITRHFSLDDYLEAYHFIEAQKDQLLKVIIDIH